MKQDYVQIMLCLPGSMDARGKQRLKDTDETCIMCSCVTWGRLNSKFFNLLIEVLILFTNNRFIIGSTDNSLLIEPMPIKFSILDARTDGRTDGLTDERTDRWRL